MNSLTDLILKHAQQKHDSVLATNGLSTLTWSELGILYTKYESLLKTFPKVTAVICKNPIERITWYLLLTLAGKTFILLSHKDSLWRIDKQIKISGAERIIFDYDLDSFAALNQIGSVEKTFLNSYYLDISTEQENAHVNSEIMYGIFTSGSTGFPRCVFHSYADVIDTIKAYQLDTGFDQHTRMASFAAPYHDATIVDLYYSALSGTPVVFVNPANLPQLIKSLKLVKHEQVNTWHCVPSVLQLIIKISREKPVDYFPEAIVLGGESASPALVRSMKQLSPDTKLFLLYGQSECSYISGFYLKDESQANHFPTNSYGLETRLQPLHEDTYELLIRTDRYAKVFVDEHKMVSTKNPQDWHLTGDTVRPSKAITSSETNLPNLYEYVGRSDYVINLAGNRISLTEIENYISAQVECDYVVVCLIDNVTKINHTERSHNSRRNLLVAAIYGAKHAPKLEELNALLTPYTQDGILLNGVKYFSGAPKFLSTHKLDREYLKTKLTALYVQE